MVTIKLIVSILIMGMIITFALSNDAIVTLTIIGTGYKVDMPVFMLIFLSMLLGWVISSLFSFVRNIKLRYEFSSQKRKLKKLESALAVTKNGTEN